MDRSAGPVAALLAASPAPERIRERAGELLRDGAWQTVLPRERTLPQLPDLSGLDLLLRVLFYGGLLAIAALAIAWLVARLRGLTRDVAAPEALAPAAPLPIPIASAEALAAEGRYGEAIHALLLETLAALSRAARLAPSLTSREIVGRVALAPRAREALAGLVTAVEITRFGGAVPDADDYRTCLARFHAFLEASR